MHAQLQMQIQWQHQQMMQQQIVQYMQTRMAHQQAMQQHLIAQALAWQQHAQAVQLQHMHLQANMSVLHMQRTHLQANTATLRFQNGHLRGNAGTLQFQRTHLQANTATLHLLRTHLQANTTTLQFQRPHLQANTGTLQHLRTRLQANKGTLQSQHTHLQANTGTLHRPSVQVRVSMSMTCGQCHQGQPAAPTLALKPPSNPFTTLLKNPRRPQMQRTIAGPVRPGMPKTMVQLPRRPLLPFVASAPAIQPIVRLPRTPSLVQVPLRLPTIAPTPAPPLGPIALLKPPPLPVLIDKPLNMVPLSSTTESTPTSSMGDAASPSDSSATATSSSLEGTISQMVSAIVEGKPSARRRHDVAETTPVSPEMLRRAPPLPVLDVKYPLPSSLAASGPSAPFVAPKPSLVEVVLRPPPLPALPDPAARTTPVP